MSTTKELSSQLEDFVWGRIDETKYLQNVGACVELGDEKLLKKVDLMQENLNKQLRKRVDENYPMLLEQASAIEILDEVQEEYHQSMTKIYNETLELYNKVEEHRKKVEEDVIIYENAMKLRRILNNGLLCKKLIEDVEKENDILKLAEIVCKLNEINRETPEMSKVKWMNEGFLYKMPEITRTVRSKVVKELMEGLDAINASTVNSCLKSLDYLHCSKEELGKIYDETSKQLDALFLKLSVNSGNNEKLSKLLPTLSTKLNCVLEQFELLGSEYIITMSKKISTIIKNRITINAKNSMRIIQTLSKTISTHNESHVKAIKDSLIPIKASILNQSLSILYAKIDKIFDEEDLQYELIAEKLIFEIKLEFSNVDWDHTLQKDVEINISKAVKYIAVKIENNLNMESDYLHLTGRVNKIQQKNYEMIHIAHLIAEEWRSIAQPLTQLVDQSLAAISLNIKELLSLVIASMHQEDMKKGLKNSSCSGYVREMRDHLKVFKTHVSELKELVENNTILSKFIDYVIENMLINFTLIKPITAASYQRFSNDLTSLCDKGLNPLNCKASVLLCDYQQITQYLKSFADENCESNENITIPSIIPIWIHLHFLINRSSNLPLPHNVKKMEHKEYVEWFLHLTDREKYEFLSTIVSEDSENCENIIKLLKQATTTKK
uniref:Conserved oligomeric Golgi complex subunit 5 n=1 Tax=Parastrongyloides trichosuri TaxID=131310 RepID=A0A0N4ZN11_PARTI